MQCVTRRAIEVQVGGEVDHRDSVKSRCFCDHLVVDSEELCLRDDDLRQAQLGERIEGGKGQVHGEAVFLKEALEDFAEIVIVFNQENTTLCAVIHLTKLEWDGRGKQ